MSDDDEKLAERIARERWNAVLVVDGRRMTGIAEEIEQLRADNERLRKALIAEAEEGR